MDFAPVQLLLLGLNGPGQPDHTRKQFRSLNVKLSEEDDYGKRIAVQMSGDPLTFPVTLKSSRAEEVFWLRHENVPQITLEGALLFDFDFFSSSGMGGALGPCLNTMEVEEYFTPKLWFYNLYAGLPLSR